MKIFSVSDRLLHTLPMYEDFHPDLELSDEFAEKLQASIDAVASGEPTIPWEEVRRLPRHL